MILDSLENITRRFPAGHGVLKVVEAARKITPQNFPKERTPLDGDRTFMFFPSYRTFETENASFEAHQKYLDVFIMVAGSETVYVLPKDKLKIIKSPYDADRDILLAEWQPGATAVRLEPGSVLVLFPEDAHAPGCVADKPETVKKIVGKVQIEPEHK